MRMQKDVNEIMRAALNAALPDAAVTRALQDAAFGSGRIILIAIGKAAWQMAHAACTLLGDTLSEGVVITKYGHSAGILPQVQVFEAGHPVPDQNTFLATEAALALVSHLCKEDTVLFLISGGGSALFEYPLLDEAELAAITKELLSCGANIMEINTVRKRLSAVKGGKFAQLCSPASVYSVVLSDIIGDPLDMIASGPAYPDSSTCQDAIHVIEKYNLSISAKARELLLTETPKQLGNVTTRVTGSVKQLCSTAAQVCRELGYSPTVLTSSLCCNARDAGSFFGSIAAEYQSSNHSLAFIAGGETVVQLTGSGKGGRNQELVLSAAELISGFKDTVIFSVGSDGTDGPTDAAGGWCDGSTKSILAEKGIDIFTCLRNNDSYHALQASGGLLITGPTGTNVNDLTVLLIKRGQ